jgi:hypothetical protein
MSRQYVHANFRLYVVIYSTKMIYNAGFARAWRSQHNLSLGGSTVTLASVSFGC